MWESSKVTRPELFVSNPNKSIPPTCFISCNICASTERRRDGPLLCRQVGARALGIWNCNGRTQLDVWPSHSRVVSSAHCERVQAVWLRRHWMFPGR